MMLLLSLLAMGLIASLFSGTGVLGAVRRALGWGMLAAAGLLAVKLTLVT
jgi:hypothetical protein